MKMLICMMVGSIGLENWMDDDGFAWMLFGEWTFEFF